MSDRYAAITAHHDRFDIRMKCAALAVRVAVFRAPVGVVFTSDASSPLVINTPGALITVWGIAVLLIAGPRRLASLISHKEHAS